MKNFCLIENNVLVEVDWTGERYPVKSVSISLKTENCKEIIPREKRIVDFFDKIRNYLNGKKRKLPVNQLDLKTLSPFAKIVLCELRKSVPYGKTITYKKLADLAGHPGAARAVGSVLRNNPFPLFFPCHRVIKSNGDIGFFQGSIEGSKLKRYLLDLELYKTQ